jgi:hypothetical protein
MSSAFVRIGLEMMLARGANRWHWLPRQGPVRVRCHLRAFGLRSDGAGELLGPLSVIDKTDGKWPTGEGTAESLRKR